MDQDDDEVRKFTEAEEKALRFPGLDPEELRRFKTALLECYKSQQATLTAFAVDRERFRQAPRYDFSVPPHAGRVWYEDFDWGMTSQRFCRLAADALGELGLRPEARSPTRQLPSSVLRAEPCGR